MKKNYLNIPFTITKQRADDDEYFYFEGYASTFGNVDLGDDRVIEGAFANTLKTKTPKQIKLYYQHDSKMPLGIFEDLKENTQGLYAMGKMPKENSQVRDVSALMKCGAIDSMSIGYYPADYSYDDKGIRLLKEIDLFEISLVSMPMNPKAIITNMKQLKVQDVKSIKTKREFEQLLRESGAFSVKACVRLASYFQPLSESKDELMFAKSIQQLNDLTNLFKN